MPLMLPDASIPLQAQAPQGGVAALGGAVQAAQGLTNLRMQQMQLGANQAISDSYKDALNPDGSVDFNKLQEGVAQRGYGAYAAPALSAVAGQQATQQSMTADKWNLLMAQQREIRGRIGTVAMDPDLGTVDKRSQITQTLLDAVRDGVLPTSQAVTELNGLPDDPAAQKSWVQNHLANSIAGEARIAAVAPRQTAVNTGAATNVYNVNPLTGQYTPNVSVPNQLGPESRASLTSNPLTGGVNVVQKDANGNIVAITNPPTQNVYVPQPGDVQLQPTLAAERDTARAQNSAAATAHVNNKLVLDNIDNVTATGVAGPGWRKLASAFGFRAGDATDPATAYDMVGKGLERNALLAAQSMGPGTNAGLEAQIKANGSLAYTPAAIKEITKLNDALVSGVQAYQPGLERAISANPAAGIFAKKQFDQDWASNFDPTIFQYYNAVKNGDTTERTAIEKKLGGVGSPGYNALLQKAANLQKLSSTGRL